MPPLTQIARRLVPVFGLMGARLAGAGFGLISQILLTWTFTAHDVGLALLAIAITTLASLLLTAGYQALTLTQLSRYVSMGRDGLTGALHRVARNDVALASAVLVAGATAAYLIVPFPPHVGEVVLYGCLAAVPLAFMRLATSAATANRRFSLSYLPELVMRPLALLVLLGAILVFGLERELNHLLIALVALTVAIAVYQVAALGPDSGFARRWRAPARDLRPYFRGRAGALLIVAIVTQCMAELVVMVSSLFFPPDQVAVVGVAIRLAALVGFIGTAAQSFAIRDLSNAMAAGQPEAVRAVLMHTNLSTLLTMAAAVLAAALFGEQLLGVFGEAYVAGYWLLLIFMVGQTCRIFGGMNGYLLALGGHQMSSAWASLVAVGVFVALACLLAPAIGLVGMALAALGAEIVWAMGLAIMAQRLNGRRGDIFSLFAPLREARA